MRVVAENSDEDIARQRAREDLEWPLRELGSNMLRVVRGAGKPYLLVSQMIDVLKACEAYHDAFGHYPPQHEFSAVLSIRHFEVDQPRDDFEWAVDRMVQGALQLAASRLTRQMTQETAGRHELMDGVTDLENARAKLRESLPPARPLRTKRRT